MFKKQKRFLCAACTPSPCLLPPRRLPRVAPRVPGQGERAIARGSWGLATCASATDFGGPNQSKGQQPPVPPSAAAASMAAPAVVAHACGARLESYGAGAALGGRGNAALQQPSATVRGPALRQLLAAALAAPQHGTAVDGSLAAECRAALAATIGSSGSPAEVLARFTAATAGSPRKAAVAAWAAQAVSAAAQQAAAAAAAVRTCADGAGGLIAGGAATGTVLGLVHAAGSARRHGQDASMCLVLPRAEAERTPFLNAYAKVGGGRSGKAKGRHGGKGAAAAVQQEPGVSVPACVLMPTRTGHPYKSVCAAVAGARVTTGAGARAARGRRRHGGPVGEGGGRV